MVIDVSKESAAQILDCLNPEHGSNRHLRKVGNYLSIETASYLTVLAAASTPLSEPKVSQTKVAQLLVHTDWRMNIPMKKPNMRFIHECTHKTVYYSQRTMNMGGVTHRTSPGSYSKGPCFQILGRRPDIPTAEKGSQIRPQPFLSHLLQSITHQSIFTVDLCSLSS